MARRPRKPTRANIATTTRPARATIGSIMRKRSLLHGCRFFFVGDFFRRPFRAVSSSPLKARGENFHCRWRPCRAVLAACLVFFTASLLIPAALGQTHPAPSQSLLAQADTVLKQMSRITGLPIRAPLKKQIVDKSQIEALLKSKLRSEMTPQQIAAEEASLKAFGLVPSNFDLSKFLISFYTEQAAGFYDPASNTMYIASWVSPDVQKMVLAHELTHALQDQSFHLEKFLRAVDKDDDESNARQAVVEGYATAAMMQSLIEPIPLTRMPSLQPFLAMALEQDPSQYPVFAKAPFFLRFEALFPYSQGLEFMQQGLKLGGWRELSRVFQSPPSDTKQIFDPEFYFDHKPQPVISLPQGPPFSKGLKLVAENTMGELGYYSLLGELLSEDEAKKMSPAWVADRYRIFALPQPGQFVLVSRTSWISPAAASEFFQDYRQILSKKYSRLVRDPRSGSRLFIGSTGHGWIALVNEGSECRWAEGIPRDQIDAAVSWLRSM